ncbi:MAG: E3 binding domain-containing protein, partial [Bryobacteraceae bacterium]|nr:E3 binding domain-containing protein [Bryobacteraceae bacterium]
MADVVMPQMGESITEGTLTKWLKKAGDTVERDEPLFEISTDKVDSEIPAPAAGVLTEILVQEGEVVAVNTVVARIGEAGAASAEAPKAESAPAPAPEPEPAPVAAAVVEAAPAPAPASAPAVETELGPVSPLVRRMARENDVDLSLVPGTGPGGRITKTDMEAYLASKSAPAAAPLA